MGCSPWSSWALWYPWKAALVPAGLMLPPGEPLLSSPWGWGTALVTAFLTVVVLPGTSREEEATPGFRMYIGAQSPASL